MAKIYKCDRCRETGTRIVKVGPNHTPAELRTGDLLLVPATDLIPKIMMHDKRSRKEFDICERCYRDLKYALAGWWII